MRTRPLAIAGCLLLAAAAGAANSDGDSDLEVVQLIPEDRAGWTPAAMFGFVRGPSWYQPRRIKVETTPPDAALDLFYVRRNFQKGYEQADAPVIVELPSRNEAGPHDSLIVRAFLDGYQQKETSIKVRSDTEELLIELDPLSNSLMAVTHLYLAGRSSLGFLTKEALTFRVQKRDEGYALVLLETGATPEARAAMAGVHDALVGSLRAQQLGEDLVVRIALADGASPDGLDVRQRQDYDPVRRMHKFTVDVAPPAGSGGSSVQRAKQALARIRPSQVGPCAMRFDEALRSELEPSSLARALTPQGNFQDPYLRATLKRLGELSPGGRVTLIDGSVYTTSVPLELAAASSQAAEVRGYLAALRAFVEELEPEPFRRSTLRGLVAPELTPAEWGAAMDRAEAEERACRG